MASDEPVTSRTRSQTTASESIAARKRQALGSSPEMSAFAADEPQSFQEAWWDPDLISRERNGERLFI